MTGDMQSPKKPTSKYVLKRSPSNPSQELQEYHDIHYRLAMAIEKEFKDLQDAGYMSPENEDMEVAVGMSIAAMNLTKAFMELLKPEEYILVDNVFYPKSIITSNQSTESNRG